MKTVEEVMADLGVDRVEAEFILAMVRGEIDGDTPIVDADGNVIRSDSGPRPAPPEPSK